MQNLWNPQLSTSTKRWYTALEKRLGDVITGQALLSTNQPVVASPDSSLTVSGRGDTPWYQHWSTFLVFSNLSMGKAEKDTTVWLEDMSKIMKSRDANIANWNQWEDVAQTHRFLKFGSVWTWPTWPPDLSRSLHQTHLLFSSCSLEFAVRWGTALSKLPVLSGDMVGRHDLGWWNDKLNDGQMMIKWW